MLHRTQDVAPNKLSQGSDGLEHQGGLHSITTAEALAPGGGRADGVKSVALRRLLIDDFLSLPRDLQAPPGRVPMFFAACLGRIASSRRERSTVMGDR